MLGGWHPTRDACSQVSFRLYCELPAYCPHTGSHGLKAEMTFLQRLDTLLFGEATAVILYRESNSTVFRCET